MVKIVISRNASHCIYKFKVTGHAGFAEDGTDIVCAAVSVLTINTVNAVEKFLEIPFVCNADEENGGFLEVEFKQEYLSSELNLLLETMFLGLRDLAEGYSSYIKLIEEV